MGIVKCAQIWHCNLCIFIIYHLQQIPEMLLLPLLTSLLAAIPVLQANSSSSPSLTPLTPLPSPGPGVRILRAPESIVAPRSDEVVFVCETSLPPERFEWSFALGRQRFRYVKASSARSNSPFTINNDNEISKLRVVVRPDTLGEYRCVAWFGPLAVTSTTARLEMAIIRGAEGNQTEWQMAAGNTLLWHCGHVDSNPAASWSFYHNGKEIQSASTLSGSNGTLLISAVGKEHSGNYSCEATNTASGESITLPGRLQLQVTGREAAHVAPHLLSGQRLLTKVKARLGDTKTDLNMYVNMLFISSIFSSSSERFVIKESKRSEARRSRD